MTLPIPRGALSLLGLLAGLAPPLAAQSPPKAFVGGRLIPIGAPEIERGVLIVAEGRIQAIGPEGSVAIPADAERIDCAGRVLMPGLVCTHSHVGLPWGADDSGPLQPEVSAIDSIDVRAASLRRARAGGITTINAMPGSGHLIGGQTVYLKLRHGNTIEDLAVRGPDGRIQGGLKMANGTNPRRAAPFPGTRAKAAALVRARYLQAQEYRDKLARAGDDPEKRPSRDLGLEALVEVLEGRRIVHHHTHRHDDIASVLRLSAEFGFRPVLHHVSDGWMMAAEIAAAGVPCSIIAVDSPGGKQEAMQLSFATGAALERAGVRVAVHTDDFITDSRLFLRSAGLLLRGGMSRAGALESVTLAGAEMLGLEDRIGSLAVGKDADLCVLDGDPLSVYSLVLETWVEGVRTFDRTDPGDLALALGGPGMGDKDLGRSCCAPFGDEEEGR
jgi:imidazolonepropionase-like amidohydrolase